jgi:DNA primase
VYTDEEGYENFYCFGCRASGTVISLHAALEKISWGKAAAFLSDGLDVSMDGELDFTIQEYEKSQKLKSAAGIKDAFVDIVLKISNLGYIFMKATNYDEDELKFLEKLYHGVDQCVWEMDLETLEQVYQFLVDEAPWNKRQLAWEERIQKVERDDFNAYAEIGKKRWSVKRSQMNHVK